MLKVAIAEDFQDATVIENDRGEWEYVQTDPRTGTYCFVGFGGENMLTVHIMTLSNGDAEVLVVHNVCDNYMRTAHDKRRVHFSHEQTNDLINDLIESVCDYPEELPVR